MNWQSLVGFDPQKHSVKTEFIAGLTTFLTMSYILAVNPDILSATGMDKGAVFTATALSSAIATILLAFLAKIPFAQAPSMGINAFFAFTLVLGMGYTWEQALAAVFIEGIIFILLTIFNVRQAIVNCIPKSLRFAISAGIGMFIAFIGLKNAGIIVDNPATLVSMGGFTPAVIVGTIGIILSGVLVVRRVRGALFYSIIICTIIGIPFGITNIGQDFTFVSMPHSISSTFFKMDFSRLIEPSMIVTVAALVFMDIFNTIGTFLGAATKTDLMDNNGRMKGMKMGLMADALGTSIGAVLGTSTVTTYIESASGINSGGRTGLTAFFVAIFFFMALFFSPVFLLVPAAATTGALVLVGVFMIDAVRNIDLNDISEAMPSFLCIIGMVLTYDIAQGMVWGILSYTLIKLLTGRYKDVNLTLIIVSILLVILYIIR